MPNRIDADPSARRELPDPQNVGHIGMIRLKSRPRDRGRNVPLNHSDFYGIVHNKTRDHRLGENGERLHLQFRTRGTIVPETRVGESAGPRPLRLVQ